MFERYDLRTGHRGEWCIGGWPTVYLIDHKGVIRWKSVGVKQEVLDAELEKLLVEAETG